MFSHTETKNKAPTRFLYERTPSQTSKCFIFFAGLRKNESHHSDFSDLGGKEMLMFTSEPSRVGHFLFPHMEWSMSSLHWGVCISGEVTLAAFKFLERKRSKQIFQYNF